MNAAYVIDYCEIIPVGFDVPQSAVARCDTRCQVTINPVLNVPYEIEKS